MSKSVYLAGPFFSEEQIDNIHKVKKLLIANDMVDSNKIYLPMEHQMEEEEFGSFRWQVGIFEMDMVNIRASDVLVAIVDYVKDDKQGVISDSGTMFEVGAAYERGIPTVLVQFDESRRMNVMLSRGTAAAFTGKNVEGLKNYDFENCPTILKDIDVF